MRLAVAALVIASVAPSAFAGETLIYSNNVRAPVTGPDGELFRDGNFSDALSSQGVYYRSEAFGQSFRIESDNTRLTRMTAWGASEYIEGDISQTSLSNNILSLEISICRIEVGNPRFPVVHSWQVSLSSITQLNTGSIVPGILSPVFQLDMLLGNAPAFSAGDYLLTVGAVLANENGSSFAWADGEKDGSTGGVGERSYLTQGEIASQWGVWNPIVDSNSSGAVQLYGIPAPGALAALLLAGSRGGRRRRD